MRVSDEGIAGNQLGAGWTVWHDANLLVVIAKGEPIAPAGRKIALRRSRAA